MQFASQIWITSKLMKMKELSEDSSGEVRRELQRGENDLDFVLNNQSWASPNPVCGLPNPPVADRANRPRVTGFDDV